MKKNESLQPLAAYTREIVYTTTPAECKSGQSLDYIGNGVGPVLGYESGQISASPDFWISKIHPHDRVKLKDCWKDVFESGESKVLVYRIKRKKPAEYVWVEDRIKPRIGRDGNIIGVVGSCVDISERKRLEDAALESEAGLPNILEDSSIGFYRVTPGGRVLFANKYLIGMLGYDSFEELSAKNLDELINEPSYHHQHVQSRKRPEKGESIRGFETGWRRKDGGTLLARENVRTVCDHGGNIMYDEGTVEEISGRSEIEEKASRLNRLLRMLSSVSQLIAHEPERDILFRNACETIVEVGGYRMAWIGLKEESGKSIVPLAWSGIKEGDIKARSIAADAGAEGESLVARAVKTGTPSVINDVESDPSGGQWRTDAIAGGFKAAGAFPMHVRGIIVGALSVYSDKKGSFDGEETHLLSELADDIGFSLWTIEARKQQEAANEVIRDRDFWLNESQRVARVGSYVYDFDARTWSGSPVLDDILGIDQSHGRNFRSWLSLIHPEDRASLLSRIRNSLPGRKKFDAEFRIIRPGDREIKWMWGTAEVLLNSSGGPRKIFGTVQDISDRKSTEEALAQSERLFHTSFENSSMGIAIIALDGKYRKVNAKLSEMLGYSREELLNPGCKDLTFPEDAAVADGVLANALAGSAKGGSVEKRYVRKDGGIIWVEFSVSLVLDRNGKPDYLIANFNDITERKRAEENFKNEHIFLRTVIDNLPNSIYAKDTSCRKTLANPANVAHTGRSSESDVLGKNDFELYPKELAEKYFADDQKVVKEGKSILITEEYGIDDNGKKRWQLTSKIPLRDKSGAIVGLVGIGTDITERKSAEETIKQERALLSTIIDQLPASVWVMDKTSRKTLVNRAHVERLSLFSNRPITSKQDVLGKNYFDLYPEENANEYLLEDAGIIRNGKAVIDREEMVIDKEGRKRWQLVSKVPLRDENGEVNGLIGIVTDITRLKEAEEAQKRERILLRTIVDSIPHPIYVKDKDYRKLLANPADLYYSGAAAESEVLGKDDSELFPKEMAEKFRADDEKVILDGEAIMNRIEDSTDSEGRKHWMLACKVPLRDEDGKVFGLVGNWTDITERMEIEEALRASEAEMRALFASMRDVVIVFDKDGKYLKIAPTDPRLLYRPAPELVGKTVHDVLPAEQAGAFLSAVNNALKTGELQSIQYSMTIGQTMIWFDANVTPLTADSVLWVARDITGRKHAEEALRKSEETLERITKSIDDTIYSIDGRTGEFDYLSPVFEKKFGYALTDIKQMGGRWEFLRHVVLNEAAPELDPVMNELHEHRVEQTPVWDSWWRCKDGSLLFIEDNSVPTYDGDRLVRIDGVLRDITERKRAEDAAQKERILLRTLIDNLPHTIYVKDRNFRKIIANQSDIRFTGFSSEADIIGKTDLDVYPEAIAAKFLADDRNVIEKGEAVLNKEELLIDSDGERHWLLTSKIPLRDADGAIIGLVGVGTDVTERRAIEEALRQSEAELRALFESMNDVIMSIDSEGRYLKIAPTDPSLLYRPAEEMIGKTIFDVLPEEQADRIFSTIKKTLLTGKTQTVEYSFMIGGEEKSRAASVSPMTKNSVIWVARDVTDRKSMEKEIIDSEKKYRELVENALVGVYKINLSGTIIYANQAMADMLEYDSPQDMMSVSSSSLYRHMEDMAGLVEELRAFGKTGKNREVEMVTKRGKVRNVLISASLDTDVISGMAKDITEIRNLERQFIQTQKLEGLGNIAAGIAHDFNNILGVIVGYSDLLGHSPFDPVKFDRGIQAIAKASDRGKSLVSQLLTFARKTEVTFESLELNSVVSEIEKLVEETFPRTIEIHSILTDGLPPVLADATQIHQVLLNLCVNARDAMPKGGTITIATGIFPGSTLALHHPEATAADYVEVTVSDTGTGMDEATRQRMFEPFFTTKGIGKGTGLGLSVVYGIIESHRGFIDVSSEPGEGTTFEIYLPVLEHPIIDVNLDSESDDGAGQRHGTILVIEDEEMLREFLGSVLTSRGYEVIFAKDGEEGIAAYRQNKERLDLVISDLGLPKLSGEQVVERIREFSGEMKIAIASGFVDPEVRSKLEEMKVVGFIPKPYKMADVLRTVNDLLKPAGKR